MIKEALESILRQSTVEARTYIRAKILLLKSENNSNEYIADKLDVCISAVRLCIDKYNAGGIEAALHDNKGRGRKAEITDSDITYYREKRDPAFDSKMHDVLVIYKQVSLQFDENGNLKPFEGVPVHTLSYDEKPGMQALNTTAEDRPPVPDAGKNSTICRDYEYVRLGTLSLLAAIGLLTGEAVPLASDTHKSSDFVRFLKMLDAKYPEGDKIRLILDNHSAYTSQETQEYLNTVPGRFEFVFTPTHGSWLNMVEGFFSKMTKQMLNGIRVSSREELEERIYKYFDEINEVPIPYHWSYRLDDIDIEKENLSQIIYEAVNRKAAKEADKDKRASKPRTRKKRGQPGIQQT